MKRAKVHRVWRLPGEIKLHMYMKGVKTTTRLAEMMGIKRSTLYLRLKRPETMRLGELERVFAALKLSAADIDEIMISLGKELKRNV
jgi:hypothetical protein